MKRYLSSLLLVLMVLTLLSTAVLAADSHDPRLVDAADLFTDEEEVRLTQMLDEVSEKQELDVVIVTTASCGNQSGQDFADDFYDYSNYAPDGILLLLCPEEGKRHISTTGECIEIFDEDALDQLIDSIIGDLNAGNYNSGCEKFIQTATEIIEDSRAFPIGLVLVAVAIGCILSFLIPMNILKGELKTVEAKKSAGDYVRKNSLKLTQNRDIFLYRNVTRTERPKENSSSSNTHTGSSGTSHGGRSF